MLWLLPALFASTSVASEAPPPDPFDHPPLSLQVQDEARWQNLDGRATTTAQSGGLLVATGVVTTLGATGLLLVGGSSGNEVFVGTGAILLTAGVGSMIVGPPILLSGSLRANQVLRERGVFSSALPGALGWAALGGWIVPAILLAPTGPGAPLVMIGAGYVSSIALGYAQLGVNNRARARAGLPPVMRSVAPRRGVTVTVVPTLRGAALAGRF